VTDWKHIAAGHDRITAPQTKINAAGVIFGGDRTGVLSKMSDSEQNPGFPGAGGVRQRTGAARQVITPALREQSGNKAMAQKSRKFGEV